MGERLTLAKDRLRRDKLDGFARRRSILESTELRVLCGLFRQIRSRARATSKGPAVAETYDNSLRDAAEISPKAKPPDPPESPNADHRRSPAPRNHLAEIHVGFASGTGDSPGDRLPHSRHVFRGKGDTLREGFIGALVTYPDGIPNWKVAQSDRLIGNTFMRHARKL